jgi:glycosyltransferase involved in cell wall biosynthesis
VTEPVVVVPCFNEARRLTPQGFLPLAEAARLLFVDDGSSDGTLDLIDRTVAALGGRASVLALPRNVGKAEAVRQGLLAAIASGAPVVGYLDADLATPAGEMVRLLSLLEDRSLEVALASRVGLLGTNIERHPARHYLGRVFATMASLILDLRVYDTQCGAKVFRASPLLLATLGAPFHARWAFDVELLGRLLIGTPALPGLTARQFVEMPLRRWTDVPESKLNLFGAPLLAIEALRICFALRRLRLNQLAFPAALPSAEDGS